MSKSKDFFEIAKSYIKEVKETQQEPIIEASKMMGDCMDNNGVVQLFGIKHGLAFSMELGYRAGGLMPFHQIKPRDLALRGKINEAELLGNDFEMDPANAKKLLEIYNILPEDMFILISFAGNEPIMIETAMEAKRNNQKVIAVISKSQYAKSPALHPSKKKLADFADLVLDTMGPCPDTVLALNDEIKINQVNTICGNVIAQMLTAETYRYLNENNKPCPVLLSANVKGADVHNREISDQYLGRWNS